MSTPTLEQIAERYGNQIATLIDGCVGTVTWDRREREEARRIASHEVLAALRSVQPEPKSGYAWQQFGDKAYATVNTSGTQPAPNQFPAPEGTGTVPEEVRMAVLCPVCLGHGLMPHGFFDHPAGMSFGSTSCEHVKCRPCNGTGIIDAAASAANEGREGT
jgi:hypothetical protein